MIRRRFVELNALGCCRVTPYQPFPPSLIGSLHTLLASLFAANLAALLAANLASLFPPASFMLFDNWLGKPVRYQVIQRHN